MSSPITCHVLNTVSGTPAANLSARLTLLNPGSTALRQGLRFDATTNEDGRVKEWGSADDTTLSAAMDQFKDGERIAWSIAFEIGSWYEERGVESFWPEVEIKFYVKKEARDLLDMSLEYETMFEAWLRYTDAATYHMRLTSFGFNLKSRPD